MREEKTVLQAAPALTMAPAADLMSVDDGHMKLPRMVWVCVAFAGVLILGFIDYITGPEISLSIFYLIPVSFATWFLGARIGFATSLLSGVIWFLADFLWGVKYSHAFIPYWNALVRLGFFVLAALLITRTKRLTNSLGAKAASLLAEMAERQRAEHALAESQKIFRLITENASDLITVLNPHGECIYSSPSYDRILEDLPEIENNYLSAVLPEDQAEFRSAFQATLKTGADQRAEYRFGRLAGPIRFLESQCSVIRDGESGPRNVLVVSRDVTRRKRMELLFADEKDVLESIAQGSPLAEVLESLIAKVALWSRDLYCSILVQDDSGNPALHQARPIEGPANQGNSAASPPGHPPLCAALGTCAGSPASIHGEWQQYREAAIASGLEMVYSKPIASTTAESLGSLCIFSRRPDDPEALGLGLFEKVAHVVAIALERQRTEQNLRRLSSLLIRTQEAERRRVARELHDSVSQILSSVSFRVESVTARLPAGDERLRIEATKAKFLLRKAIQEVRSISENLRPSELDELGLAAAVRDLCDEFQDRTDLQVHVSSDGMVERLPVELELALYRIVQEGLRNIEKHAEATEVNVGLECDQRFATLTLRDNGKGLNLVQGNHAGAARTGMGLIDMRERCAFLGGSFLIRSEPNHGTEIAARIPLSPLSSRSGP